MMAKKKYKKPYEDLPKQSTLRHVCELIERLENEPRFAFVSAHSFIELLVSILIRDLCKNGKRISDDQKTFSHSSRLIILNEVRVIPDKLFQILDYMRKLRNDCVHQPTFNITENHIKNFEKRGFSFELHLPKNSKESKITWLLWGIIGEMWNVRADIFTKKFLEDK